MKKHACAFGGYKLTSTILFILLLVSFSWTTSFSYGPPENLPDGAHPRLFLTPQRLAELRTNASLNSPEWTTLRDWCSTHLNDTGWQTTRDTRWQAGYRMSAFGQHIVNYALAYQILKASDPALANTYGRHAIDIMNATLQNFSAGEELDGIVMIRQGEVCDATINAAEQAALKPYNPNILKGSYKNGYASRDICTSYALAYDWVYDLLSSAEKTKFTRMMYRWVDWMRGVRSVYNNGILLDGIRYHEDQAGDCTGINNCTTASGNSTKAYALDSVPNNFFSGHFLLSMLVPLATFGDNPDAATYLSYARDTLWENLVKPELTSPLGSKGGNATEGWNYAGGWYRDLEAIYALKQATGEDVFNGFDWPKEFVNCYLNVTNSSLKSVLNYGEITGNYGKAQPYQSIILSPSYIVRKEYPGAEAGKLGQYYLNHASFANYAPAWSKFLWTDPTAEEKDFSLRPLYYHAIGSGLVTMRSSWNAGPDTVFASVQLGGRMAPGVAHENYDQGNIFLHRGEDVLLAHQNMQRDSVSHNTIVFNNANHHASNPALTAPAIDRIANEEAYLYTRGNIANAWKRAWKVDGNKQFTRNILYIRPNYLIVYDTTQSNPAVGLVKDWYTNYVADPALDTVNNVISAIVGSSKIYNKTLFPINGTLTKTAPATGYWRVKFTPSALQEYDQFLHVMEATASTSQTMTPVERIQSTDGKMIGAYIHDSGKPTIVLFSADKNGKDVAGSDGDTISYEVSGTSGASLQHILTNLPVNTDMTILPPLDADGTRTFTVKFGNYPSEGMVQKSSDQGVLSIAAMAADTTVPSVTITSPQSSGVASGQATITASASDNVGVKKVDFYVNEHLVSSVAAAPYTSNLDTTALANGVYTISAKAYDAAGNVGQSSGVSVSVYNDFTPPTVSVTSPANGAIVRGIVPITAGASDNLAVTKVEFYVNGILQANDTAAPFSYSWNTSSAADGDYQLSAKAYDAAGNVGQSSNSLVKVRNTTADSVAPVVTLKTATSISSKTSKVVVSASAKDNSGVSLMQLFIDKALRYVTSSSSFTTSIDISSLPKGTHTVLVKALDAAGNVGQKTVTITR